MLGLFSGIAFSQGSTGRRHQDPNYLVTRTVSEAIITIDLKASELLLRDFDGKPHRVKVDKETKFSDPRATTLNDLHEGQRIRLTYRPVDSVVLELRPIEPSPSMKQP
jgi:hypothetical protein